MTLLIRFILQTVVEGFINFLNVVIVLDEVALDLDLNADSCIAMLQ